MKKEIIAVVLYVGCLCGPDRVSGSIFEVDSKRLGPRKDMAVVCQPHFISTALGVAVCNFAVAVPLSPGRKSRSWWKATHLYSGQC